MLFNFKTLNFFASISKVLIIVFLFVFQLSKSNAQTIETDHLFRKAFLLHRQDSIKLAIKAYEEAIFSEKLTNIYPSHFYNLACCYSLEGNYDNAFKYLNIAIDHGWDKYFTLIQDPDLASIKNEVEWDLLIDKLESKINEYADVRGRLETLHFKDQYLRKKEHIINSKYGSNSIENKVLWELINYQDSLNIIEFENIYAKYGWLGMSKVGEKASNAMWLIIQHSNLDIQLDYIEELIEMAKIGEISPGKVAIMQDRILMDQGKKQIYGTQVMESKTDGTFSVYPIENPVLVDSLREEMGMISLEKYLDVYFGIQYELKN